MQMSIKSILGRGEYRRRKDRSTVQGMDRAWYNFGYFMKMVPSKHLTCFLLCKLESRVLAGTSKGRGSGRKIFPASGPLHCTSICFVTLFPATLCNSSLCSRVMCLHTAWVRESQACTCPAPLTKGNVCDETLLRSELKPNERRFLRSWWWLPDYQGSNQGGSSYLSKWLPLSQPLHSQTTR